ncbi:Squalene epoxidase [Agyrium rufum]|nr:Squalene epoxidase [Agyrium rufum]
MGVPDAKEIQDRTSNFTNCRIGPGNKDHAGGKKAFLSVHHPQCSTFPYSINLNTSVTPFDNLAILKDNLPQSQLMTSPLALPSSHPLYTPTELHRLRRTQHHDCDAVVVGAGIFGSAIAITLARQGRSVILLEKSLKEPDRIVGELLQPGGVEALEKLGLRHCLEEIDACVVKGYEVFYYGQGVNIPYPADVVDNGKRPEGRSFHHGRFIRRLREAAMKESNITVVESTVTSLVQSDCSNQILGVTALTKGEMDYYFGSLTVVADGYASKFRKQYMPHSPTSKSKFWGLELIDADLPYPGHGHVILSSGAPVLLYQIGTHETRALVDIPDNVPTASHAQGGVKSHLRNVVLPSLPPSVQPSFKAALDEGKLRSMPNSFLPPSTNKIPGLVLLGDAMNMRHPLTGGGMTVALNDVLLLRDLLSPETVPLLTDTTLVLKQMRTFHWRRKNLTAVINILAQALYSLFAANDPQLRALQLGCFKYFQQGGACIDGPIGLLAGIIRQPLVLFYHFFSVALLSMWLVLSSSPIWRLPVAGLDCLSIFTKACLVLFPFIGTELRS